MSRNGVSVCAPLHASSCAPLVLCLPVPTYSRVLVGVGDPGGKEAPAKECLPCLRPQNVKYILNGKTGEFSCYFQYIAISKDIGHETRSD